MPDYHINPDGSIPCTNCGEDIEPFNCEDFPFSHVKSNQVICYISPYRGEVACPEPRGDDGQVYDESGRLVLEDLGIPDMDAYMKSHFVTLSAQGRQEVHWSPASPHEAVLPNGVRLRNIHDESACEGDRYCIIHKPSDHALNRWTLHWRDDRGIFERLCPDHGVGHPDPDQVAFWIATDQEWQTVHGCCGCCTRSVDAATGG